MKIESGYILRQVMDVYVIIGVGSEAYAPNEIMSLNESGAFLWHLLEREDGAEQTDLEKALVQEYGIDAVTARNDVEAFLARLREKALITE